MPARTAPTSVDLAGTWQCAIDPAAEWSAVELPANWYLRGIDGPETVWFRRSFDVPGDHSGCAQRLRFDGVDYTASVEVDGHPVGHHTGGFSPFALPVELPPGSHELVVRVDCPVEPPELWPHAKTTLRGVMGHHDARPGNWTARGQERSTGGIWGPVRLTAHLGASVEAVGFTTEQRGADAWCRVPVRCELHDAAAALVTVRVSLRPDEGRGDVAYELWSRGWLEPGTNEVVAEGPLAAPRWWWTWDHGEPHRYACDVSLVAEDGTVLDEARRLVGVRDVEVDDSWTWRLNGRPVFIRGVNYIGSQWLSELTPEVASRDVALARDAHLNLLRVHAHVTAPAVYDACDAAGILVWQDLPLQWGYADSAATYAVARRMVDEVVELHGWRPSVALWCAHNEAPWNEPWMAEETGTFVVDQNRLLDEELAERFRTRDPSRPAVANSGSRDGHTYPGWYWGRWTDVGELPGVPFVSEYGAQATPDLACLREFLPEGATADDWTYHGFQHHEHHVHVGVNLFEDAVERVVERSQAYQARLLQFATEVYRRRKRERVQGVVPFMLVDPWPCVSWSVLDHHRHPKPGYHALRRAMQPVLPSIEAEHDTFAAGDTTVFGLWFVNDLAHGFPRAHLTWRLCAAEGAELDAGSVAVDVLPDSARRVERAGPFALPPGRYRLEARLADERGAALGENRWAFEVEEAGSQ